MNIISNKSLISADRTKEDTLLVFYATLLGDLNPSVTATNRLKYHVILSL